MLISCNIDNISTLFMVNNCTDDLDTKTPAWK